MNREDSEYDDDPYAEIISEDEIISSSALEIPTSNIHYPHPFHFDGDYEDRQFSCKEHPRTVSTKYILNTLNIKIIQILEMRMCALSAAIREKPEWWTKRRDPEIRKTWRHEALEQQAGLPEGVSLSANKVCTTYHVVLH